MPARITGPTTLAIILTAAVCGPLRADPWPQFRGPDGKANATGSAKFPTEIAADRNVLWKVPLPTGHSSPVVYGDRVFVAAERDKRLFVIALDSKTGRTLWTTEAAHKRLETVHQVGNHAQSTCATDGKVVVSFFGSNGMFCHDASDGRELWHVPYGPFKNEFGAAASPILVDGKAILNQDHDVDSFLTAVDVKTGAALWKIDRSEFPRSFATPVVWEVNGKKQIVMSGCIRVVGYDLETGAEVWTVRGLSRNVPATPTIGPDNNLYVSAWTPGTEPGADQLTAPPTDELFAKLDKNKDGVLTLDEFPDGPLKQRFTQIDRNKDGKITREEYDFLRKLINAARVGMLCIRPGGKGDVTADHVVWRQEKLLPYVPSPVVTAGAVFTVKNGGVVVSRGLADGEIVKQGRVAGGDYYASPVTGDGKLYLVSRNGVVTVLSAEAEWKELFSAELGEEVYATPALADGRIYLRTAKHLYCFGAK